MLEQYTKYDYLFSNLRPNAIGGIKIFSRDDDFIIQQKYDAITDEEHDIWSRLFTKLINPLDRYACAEYINGLAALGLRQDKMPNFAELNPKIKEASGWELVPVAGFLDEYVFFELNANRKFPVTDIVRQSDRMDEKYSDGAIQNEDDYTPEPDVFHDVRGHVPMRCAQFKTPSKFCVVDIRIRNHGKAERNRYASERNKRHESRDLRRGNYVQLC